MKFPLRRLVLPVLLVVAALVGPASVSAAPPLNDVYGNRTVMPAYGGTMDAYTYQATMENGYFSYGNVGNWGWSMWYTWTAPIAGKVRFDLCQTGSVMADQWYIAAWRASEGPSPLSYNVAASSGCAGNTMPQGDFTAVAGTEYTIAIGSQTKQNTLAMLRISYEPQLATAPTITGAAAVGQTLRATPPTWTTPADRHTLSWPVWSRCAADGSACTPLVLKGSDTYTLVAADAGSTFQVAYTATNAAGSIETLSTRTAPVLALTVAPTPGTTGPGSTVPPIDADGDGIPDQLITTLGLPAGAPGVVAMCVQYALCRDDPRQVSIFAALTTMQVIDGALIELLIGSSRADLLIADPRASITEKRARLCDGAGGSDVCVGSAGPDRCIAYVGDDFCLGNRGNDTCISKAGNDVCYGGEGADSCITQPVLVPGIAGLPMPAPSTVCMGGGGADTCVVNIATIPRTGGAWLPNLTCAGGAANDTCKAAAVKLVNGLKLKSAGVLRMKCSGDAGNDTCGVAKSSTDRFASLTRSVCSGGTGNDLCVANGAVSFSNGELGARNSVMTCTGGPGEDTLWTLNGRGGDVINGGGQAGDYCFADEGDVVVGCGQTLRYQVSPADLRLIDGTPTQRAQFVAKSVAKLNGTVLDAETEAKAAARIAAMSAELEKLQLQLAERMRALVEATI